MAPKRQQRRVKTPARRQPFAGPAGPRRRPPRRKKRPPTPLPLTVVIGFLGAGKASLLNALRDPAHAGTLVIINEFGEIGLDHLLVERTATCWCRIRAFCMRRAAPLAPAAFRSLPRI